MAPHHQADQKVKVASAKGGLPSRDVPERADRDGIDRSMRVRIAHVAAYGATLGGGLASVVNLLDWAARRGLGDVTVPEVVRLTFVDSIVEIVFRGLSIAFSWRGALALAIVAALWVWLRTQPLARTVVGIGVAVSAAWIAAVACTTAYLLDPTSGLLASLISLIPAALLVRRPWSVTAMVVAAAGLAFSTFSAQVVVALGQRATGYIITPLYGFLPPAVLSLSAAWWVSKYTPDYPLGFTRGLTRFWGLSAFCVCTTFSVALESIQLRARPPEPSGIRVLNESAYDVHLKGEPPALLWTNTKLIQVLDDVYGDTHRRYALDSVPNVERISSSFNGDFYVQGDYRIGWWGPVHDGHAIPHLPSAWLHEPDWLLAVSDGSGAAFVEDPITRRLLLISEYHSRYAVVDRDTSTTIATGILSDTMIPWWYATVDAAARVAYISTAIDDGRLYEFDLDSLRITRKASNVYLYETVIDSAAHLLWGARPLTGELLGVDTRTLDIRYRIPVESAVRDIQRDAETGELYTCSFMSGNVFRVDPQTQAASKIGWCGRVCRNLFLDSRHGALWVATADAVCRIPLLRSGGGVSPSPP